MELHVQSWFTLDLAQEAAKGTLIAGYCAGEVDVDRFTLGKREFLLDVKRAGMRGNPEEFVHLHLRADAETDAKVRAWIKGEAAFAAAKVAVGDGEVLVQVRGECCSCTSHGIACVETCPYY